MEDVIAVEGEVRARPKEMVRDDSPAGAVEVAAARVVMLNKSEVIPFNIADDVKASEELRLKYRYLDLRRRPLKENIEASAPALLTIRNFLSARRFLEIETPMLVRATPEGARDYLVPEPVAPGKLLRAAAESAALQADPDGGRLRPLLPDRALLARRRLARRPPARAHPDRHRNELRGGERRIRIWSRP